MTTRPEISIDQPLENGATSLLLAARFGHADVVELLPTNRANPLLQTRNGFTALSQAAAFNQPAICDLFLRHGADKNAGSPVYSAAESGNMDCAEVLLKGGCDPNSHRENVTALHIAAFRGNAPMCSLLLKYKADPSLLDRAGLTPLEMAERQNFPKVVAVLNPVTFRVFLL